MYVFKLTAFPVEPEVLHTYFPVLKETPIFLFYFFAHYHHFKEKYNFQGKSASKIYYFKTGKVIFDDRMPGILCVPHSRHFFQIEV